MNELKLGINKRKNFSNRIEKLEIPNLNDIQTQSYRKLENERIDYLCNTYFPIRDEDGEYEFRYKGLSFGEPEQKFEDESEYRNRGLNYTRPLHMAVEIYDLKNDISVLEREVFLCNLPVISERGTFIINGVERVIVSQLVRSPDLYVTVEKEKQSTENKIIGQIMPARGTRISVEQRFDRNLFSGLKDVANQIRQALTDEEVKRLEDGVLESDELLIKNALSGEYRSAKPFLTEAKKEIRKNSMKFQFDSSRKISPLSFLYVLGFSQQNILNVMGDTRLIRDILLMEDNPSFTKALNSMISANIISNVNTEDENEEKDYKSDIDNIFATFEERGYEIPADLDEFFTKITNEELDELVIKKVNDDKFSHEMLEKFFSIAKKNGLNAETSLLRKNEFAYRQKRRVREDLFARFTGRGYSFGEVGRSKFNLKADLVKNTKFTTNSRFYQMKLAEDVVSPKDSKKVIKEGTIIGFNNMKLLNEILSDGFGYFDEVIKNKELGLNETIKLQKVKVYSSFHEDEVVEVIGIRNSKDNVMHLAMADIIVFLNYYTNLAYGVGKVDDKDHLSNRRVRLVGELVEQEMSKALYEIERKIIRYAFASVKSEDVNEKSSSVFVTTAFNSAVQSFFSSSQLSQFMDQINPLSELTNKRRLSALGPGGISRERATMDVRDVHSTHYGRICPVESPEGGNIGLISSLTVFAKINEQGFIETPYIKVDKKYNKDGSFKTSFLTNKIEYLSALQEDEFVIGQSTVDINEKTDEILTTSVPSRFNGNNNIRPLEQIDYIEISPKQIFSAGTGLIPFLEHDDANRALMGANMQRQAVPLMISESPIVGTSMEHHVGKDSSAVVTAKCAGTVKKVNSKHIIITDKEGSDVTHRLQKYTRTNQSTIINQHSVVKEGQKVKKNQVIADGNGMENGELALGKNATVAFLTWDGYNYEDAIIISDRLVKEDVYTSIHIEEYTCEVLQTKLGLSQITRDIPNVGEESKRNLDERGIVVEGTVVKPGDILVGKVVPKAKTEPTPEEKLLYDILGEKAKDVKDESLRVEHGGGGIVHKVLVYDAEEDNLDVPSEVKKLVKVYVVQKRKIQEGDKMAGRHGNKGVISKVLPMEDMPYLEDGTPVDIMLNPLGVPSRMNVGQVLEMHLGILGKMLGMKFATEVFEGAKEEDLHELMEEAGISKTGKFPLYDGRTGEKYDRDVTVGVMYILKLSHMVEDKMHARSIGPYALVTQQPLGGKAQFGGQRFGEMEVWALEAYGAANALQEMLTLKSDDIFGRSKMYESIVNNKKFDEVVVPESFNVLLNEIQGLGIDLGMYDENEKEIKLTDIIEY